MASVVSEYFDILTKYVDLYGLDTVVLMQVGSFYEVYGVDNDTESLGNVAEIAELLNVVLTKRNKRLAGNSRTNPLLLGFPCLALSKYVPVLLEDDYTIVVVDQDKTGLSIKRTVTEVISPATYMEGCSDEYMMMLYVETTRSTMHVGISAISVMTGKSVVHECHSPQSDPKLPLDEIVAFVHRYRPREAIVSAKGEPPDVPLEELGIKCTFRYTNPIAVTVAYHEKVLGHVFRNDTMLSNVEFLDLEKMPCATISYVLLIEHVYSHRPLLIKKVSVPEILVPQDHLELATNTIEQLNLVASRKGKRGRCRSVLGVIDHCSTSVGKRLLKERLLSPAVDPDVLEARYRRIEEFGEAFDEYKWIESHLSRISDIQKLQRRMSLGIMSPNELASTYFSYKTISELYEETEFRWMEPQDVSEATIFTVECETTFHIERLLAHNLDDPSALTSVFREGAFAKIDGLERDIEDEMQVIVDTAHSLSMHLSDPFAVRVDYLQNVGHYLLATNLRVKRLRDYEGIEGMSMRSGKTLTRITSPEIDAASRRVCELTGVLRARAKKCYTSTLSGMYDKYSGMFARVTRCVAELDVLKSSHKVATLYGYCRPTICRDIGSHLKARDLRHVIMERIDSGAEYVPNDVVIGDGDNTGMVLYSMNAGGKTSLLKACGIAVILAQMGCYVPASEFSFYPFATLMTRILSEDNILRGQSSFVAEMSELRAILKRANEATLVLADEITHGTEHTSGSAIFVSSVETLAKRSVRFMFTTHLHNVHPLIITVQGVRVCHLSIRIDGDTIVFERKIKEGPGDSIYGLEVCQSLHMDEEFLARAFEVRHRIEADKGAHTLSPIRIKKSRYNSRKLLQFCEVCHYSPRCETDLPLDTHHIKPQCESDHKGSKDAKFNLVALCKACHDRVHEGDIVIDGYVDTSEGLVLSKSSNSRSDLEHRDPESGESKLRDIF